jgi:predicted nucleotide-binding protein (sugar kinase/HSP70/actin superfamily)
MGNLGIALKAILEEMGQEVSLPPPITKKTLDLGVKYSPECACLPFKINLGNFIEALDNGADTILMIADGGRGSCRMGFYGCIHASILKELGYNFQFIAANSRSKIEFLSDLARLGKNKPLPLKILALCKFYKMRVCEEMERLSHHCLPYEVEKGATRKAYKEALRKIDEASSMADILRARWEARLLFSQIKKDYSRKPLRVLIVGEIYVVWEPFVNLDIENRLGEMGVEVVRKLWLTDNILYLAHLDFLCHGNRKKALQAAKRYLGYNIGAECNISVGEAILSAHEGYDGVIHLMPFTCMPEIIASSIMQQVSCDYDVPILTFILDEHSGEAGMATRLEAFIDLLWRRRAQN